MHTPDTAPELAQRDSTLGQHLNKMRSLQVGIASDYRAAPFIVTIIAHRVRREII